MDTKRGRPRVPVWVWIGLAFAAGVAAGFVACLLLLAVLQSAIALV